jgi:5'-3' exonuclease
MKIHLIDGTYELFRGFYGPPSRKAPDGREVGATVSLLQSLISLLSEPDVTHIGCAFDHEIKSFRNDLFAGYKTGEGVDPDLLAQFSMAEEAVTALGIVTWPMVEFEADDALGTAALRYAKHSAVEQVVICTPDKDLAQVVSGDRIVCWDRRREIVYNQVAVIQKYGVPPHSIPDWLALVGDAADGIPGVPSWGAKSSATMLSRYLHLEDIPTDFEVWDVKVRGASRLYENLIAHREQVFLYRRLTRLRLDVPLEENLEDLQWQGPSQNFNQFCQSLGADHLLDRLSSLT